jgi:hypothetical protein
MARGTNSIRLDDPYPKPMGPHLVVADGQPVPDTNDTGVSFEDGAIKVEQDDGSVVIRFDGKAEEENEDEENLAKRIDDGELETIASDLIEGIIRDEESRKEWMETRAMGISLLGLKLEKPRSDAGSSQAPLEGMSTVRHPLLLEATVSFQATARGELLPSGGPVKVRNDSTIPPQSVMQTNAAQDLADSLQVNDELAQALERDMNHYLTHTAPEYVPDTDRMLFYVGFGGDGFKKVYNCPLRRRPVSESVDAEDLIVSNAAVDLRNCARVTHRIRMRKSVLRRMQILGVYRDVELNEPQLPTETVVDQKKNEIAGYKPITKRPEDRDYEVYESYCELDLNQFAPKKFKGKGLPLPYRVTLEKESRKILDIRRNWDEDDDECTAKHFFVQFPFIRGLGFYGLGYVHLLGNTTNALTGAWRMTLDAGMFASFPGFLYAKGAGRQNSNQFRVPPGGGIGLDVGAQTDIRQAVMPLPYREVGAGFSSFLDKVEAGGQRIAATANIGVGEGKQEAPVGTTLALIEQATKVIDSAHKRLHAAQAEEFQLLKARFQEDPEAFWRHNKRPTIQWKKEQFIEALNKSELVPVADPNNPTSLHRLAKAMAIKQLQQASPELYDPVAVDMRVMRIADIDPQGLFRAQPAQQPPDPRLEAVKAKAMSEQQRNQIAQTEAQIKAKQVELQAAEKAKDRESREKIETLKLEIQKLKVVQEQIIHAHDEQRNQAMMMHDMQQQKVQQAHELQSKAMETRQSVAAKALETHQALQHEAIAQQHELRGGLIHTAAEMELERERHRAEMQREREDHADKMAQDREAHAQKMEQQKQLNDAKIEAAKAMARVKPKKEKPGG